MRQFGIRKALVTKVQSLGLTIPLNYANMVSTEVVPFADVYIFFAQPSAATMGDDGEDAHSGFMQFTLNMKIDEGDGATLTLSDTISAAFKAGTRCLYGDQVVTISNCGVGGGIIQGGKFITPITINWYARTRR